MKTLFRSYYLFLLLAFGMLACQDEENNPGTGEIQFAVNDLLQSSSGRTAAALPDGASLLISVEDASGNAIFTLKKLELISFGGQYTSAPLKLENGDYKLTDFIIVGPGNAVVYATPREGSLFASLVTRPLPVSFAISTGQSTSVPTQVVRADEATPEDFGYATFPISIAPYPEFSVSVFAFRAGNVRLTSAQAYLLHEGDTIYRKYLGPQVSDIVFKGEQDEAYTLVLIRSGFAKYTRSFVLSELREELNGEPLEITLQQAISMTMRTNSEGSFSFYLAGVPGKKVTFEWSNGYAEEITLAAVNGDNYYGFEYGTNYPHAGTYFVSVTGDIDAVTHLGFRNNGTPVDVGLQHASGLRNFRLYHNRHLKQLDFSGNPQLRAIQVGFADITSINLAHNKSIKEVRLEELRSLSTAAIDKIIDDVHRNAIEEDTHFGTFWAQRWNEQGQKVWLGPPSPASFQKLDDLNQQLFWDLEPYF